MLSSILSTLIQQVCPCNYLTALVKPQLTWAYHAPLCHPAILVRGPRTSLKAHSWTTFAVAQLFVEINHQILFGILVWTAWYSPVFGAKPTHRTIGTHAPIRHSILHLYQHVCADTDCQNIRSCGRQYRLHAYFLALTQIQWCATSQRTTWLLALHVPYQSANIIPWRRSRSRQPQPCRGMHRQRARDF